MVAAFSFRICLLICSAFLYMQLASIHAAGLPFSATVLIKVRRHHLPENVET